MSEQSLRLFRPQEQPTQVVLWDERLQKALLMHYRGALELARVLEEISAGSEVRTGDCRVVCTGVDVHLLSSAGFCITFPFHLVAQRVASGLQTLAKQAEEVDRAEQIIRDNAVLAWMDVPCGLSDNPLILAETRKEAERYINREKRPPGGIEPRAILGTPTIINKGNPS